MNKAGNCNLTSFQRQWLNSCLCLWIDLSAVFVYMLNLGHQIKKKSSDQNAKYVQIIQIFPITTLLVIWFTIADISVNFWFIIFLNISLKYIKSGYWNHTKCCFKINQFHNKNWT